MSVDKKYAHKDDDYEPVPFQSLLELTERFKKSTDLRSRKMRDLFTQRTYS